MKSYSNPRIKVIDVKTDVLMAGSMPGANIPGPTISNSSNGSRQMYDYMEPDFEEESLLPEEPNIFGL